MVIVVDELLFQTSHLNHSVFVFLELQLLMIVKKIVEFTTVDLVHRNSNGEVSFMVFPIIDSFLEQIFDSDVLQPIHCVRLSGTSLAISKDGDNTLVKDKIQDRTHLIKVQLFVRLIIAKSIIEFVLGVVNHFGYTIHFVFTIMHNNFRIGN